MNFHSLTEDLLSAPMTIRVLSRPDFIAENFSEFLSSERVSWVHEDSSAAESLIEAAGRVCYMSFGEKQFRRKTSSYIKNLINSGHESVLEHANWSFLLTGVSRAFTHQFVRHRVGFSFSQLSQQYHDESNTRFVLPHEIRSHLDLQRVWIEAMQKARDAYRQCIEELRNDSRVTDKEKLRAARSAARSILPNCTETKIVFSANARAIRHFLSVRGCIVGDLEMREVATKVFEIMSLEAPSLFPDFAIEQHRDGHPIVRRCVTRRDDP